ncbi:hypothetical protein CEUSTIGMA_g10168.t1 [Chlamydomonas eustigma]|uniref:Protein kinase domain-containing protein n=1 Tax=Chlamydomonas eustigma TaxID=1157962 RepID=A0A250XIK4_9CHLO|nr:hypothetical protein CEUSTIGMA_g10168.t1 [Chlamydomonas eustigma]|eukprot:GAX82742.1 hypothetical protein CEUSTIGMA_g10168.t1 [Chlamydomonas eustigma]
MWIVQGSLMTSPPVPILNREDHVQNSDEEHFDEGLDTFGTPPVSSWQQNRSYRYNHGGRGEGGRRGRSQQKLKQSSIQSVSRTVKAVTLERKESKDKRQKARLEARAFKEVDTVMEALGVVPMDPAETMDSGPAPPSPGRSASNISLGSATSSASHGRRGPPVAIHMRHGSPSFSSDSLVSEQLSVCPAGTPVCNSDSSTQKFPLNHHHIVTDSTQGLKPPMRYVDVASTPAPRSASSSTLSSQPFIPKISVKNTHNMVGSGRDSLVPRSKSSSETALTRLSTPQVQHSQSANQLDRPQQSTAQSRQRGLGGSTKPSGYHPHHHHNHHHHQQGNAPLGGGRPISPQTMSRRSLQQCGSSGDISATSASSSRRHHAHKRQPSAEQCLSGGPGSGGGGGEGSTSPHEASSTAERDRLVAERASWQQRMNDVLDGRFTLDDIEGLVGECLSKAGDIKQQLIVLETLLTGWKEIDERLDMLAECVRQAKLVLRDLEPHKHLLMQSDMDAAAEEDGAEAKDSVVQAFQAHGDGEGGLKHQSPKLSAYERVRMLMLPEMLVAVQMFSSSVCDVFGRTFQTEEEVRLGSFVVSKLIKVVKSIIKDLFREPSDAASAATLRVFDQQLGDFSTSVVLAVSEASTTLADKLLHMDNLNPRSFVHETSTKSKALQAAWRASVDIAAKVGRQWCGKRLIMQRSLLQSVLHATECATVMHETWLPADTEEDLDDIGVSSGLTGAWGCVAMGNSSSLVGASTSDKQIANVGGYSGVLTDEDVQAHAWVPGLLLALLDRSQVQHRSMREELSQELLASFMDDAEEEELYSLLDKLQACFSRLAIANTRRTALLCGRPQPLSYFALEILRDQAEQALRLVQKYDSSTLGLADLLVDEDHLGGDTQKLFSALKVSTDHVANGLLRVRRLLKLRRADEDNNTQMLPRVRFPTVQPHQQLQQQRSHSSNQSSAQGSRGQKGQTSGFRVPQQELHASTTAAKIRGNVSQKSAADASLAVAAAASSAAAAAVAVGRITAAGAAAAHEIPPDVGREQRDLKEGASGLKSSRVEDLPVKGSSSTTADGSCSADVNSTRAGATVATPPSTDSTHACTVSTAPVPPGWPASLVSQSSGGGTFSDVVRRSMTNNPASTSGSIKQGWGTAAAGSTGNRGFNSMSDTRFTVLSKGGLSTELAALAATARHAPQGVLDPYCLSPGAAAGPASQPTSPVAVPPSLHIPRSTQASPFASAPYNEDGVLVQQLGLPSPASALHQGSGVADNVVAAKVAPSQRRSPFATAMQQASDAHPNKAESSSSAAQAEVVRVVPDSHFNFIAGQGIDCAASPLGGAATPVLFGGTSPVDSPVFKGRYGATASMNGSRQHASQHQLHQKEVGSGSSAVIGSSADSDNTLSSRKTRKSDPQCVSSLGSPSPSFSTSEKGHREAAEKVLGTATEPVVGMPSPSVVLLQASLLVRPSSFSTSSVSDGFWNIKWRDIKNELIDLVGSGSFGHVWHAIYHHEEVAVKVVSIDRNQDFDNAAVDRFRQEVEIQRRLSHTNIVQFRGACCDYVTTEPVSAASGSGGSFNEMTLQAADSSGGPAGSLADMSGAPAVPMMAIVMEYCRLGNLFKIIKQARELKLKLKDGLQADPRLFAKHAYYRFYMSWERRLEIAYGIAAGLEFMHFNNVVHRDLTSYNVLLEPGKQPGSFIAKVCDFNLSRIVPREQLLAKSVGGPNSPAWASPELLEGKEYGFPHDTYTFGIILWEIMTLKVPWSEEPGGEDTLRERGLSVVRMERAIDKVINGDRPPLPEPEELEPPLPEAARLMQLTRSCWAQDQCQRPAMREVANEVKEILSLVRIRRQGTGVSSGGQQTSVMKQ